MLFYQMTGFMEGDPPPPDHGFKLPERDKAALLLDFDGTLVDIAPTPDGVEIPDSLQDLLDRAMERLDGRVALVSGRRISDLEAFLPRFGGVLIGSHGAERRIDGVVSPVDDFDQDKIATLQRLVTEFARLQPAFLVETKNTGVVLHYRQAQELGALALHFMDTLAAAADGFRLQPALCAYEIKPDSVGKDIALGDLFAHAPFAGAVPIYAGDDLTDEPALAWAAAQGGTGIKIGDADSVSSHRVCDPAALRTMLERWLG